MNYQYLIGQRVKGYVNGVIVAVDQGILKIEFQHEHGTSVAYADLAQVEIITI